MLEAKDITNIILAGFTANDCIEATARDGFEKGFNCFVVGDATAMFDFLSHDNKLYKAEKIHDLVLSNIHLRYAKVENTQYFLNLEY